jgi:hypothetical protein
VIVLAEGQAECGGGSVSRLTRKPRGRDEAGWLQAKLAYEGESSIQAFTGAGTIQGQELAFSVSLTPRTPAIPEPARQAIFVVSLAMQDDFGTVARPGPDPIDEPGMILQRPFPVPVRHDEERRGHSALGTEVPETQYTGFLGRADVVDRDQQYHRLRIPR